MVDIRAALGEQRRIRDQRLHRHRWGAGILAIDNPLRQQFAAEVCRCGAVKDIEKSKRGRTARQRGNAYERDVAARLGARRVGQYGGREDVAGDWIVAQCKNGGAFPERIWRWLQALPANGDQLRAVVIGDAPGAGTKRREVIVLDLADFVEWFGRRPEDAA